MRDSAAQIAAAAAAAAAVELAQGGADSRIGLLG